MVLETIAATRATLQHDGVVLVPTMGALHEGHLALVARARELGQTVVVSIFVNPLQFGPNEDLDRYPHTLDEDLDKLALAGASHVFAPSVAEMYPHGAAQTRVVAGAVGGLYEGASRPGHFDGVLTVVAKLLGIVRPAFVVFGQKDAQQLHLVRRMVEDLSIPTRVEAVDIVRDEAGLALSSRNRFLDANERRAALGLSRALATVAASVDRGAADRSAPVPGIDGVLTAARAVLADDPLVKLDYLTVVDPETFLPVDDHHRGAALALIAANVGDTRLIDNRMVVLNPSS